MLKLFLICAASVAAAATWRSPADPAIGISAEGKVVSQSSGGYNLVSEAEHAATPGDVFEIRVRARLDFAMTVAPAPPSRLARGESARLCYDVNAPEAINLTSEYNRTSYAQWTATWLSNGRLSFAHTWARLEVR